MPKLNRGATAANGGQPQSHDPLIKPAPNFTGVKPAAAPPSFALVDPQVLAEQVADRVFEQVAELLSDSSQGERLLDDAGLRQTLQCSQPTLRCLIEAGLPHVKVGEMRRYRASSVFTWLESRNGAAK